MKRYRKIQLKQKVVEVGEKKENDLKTFKEVCKIFEVK